MQTKWSTTKLHPDATSSDTVVDLCLVAGSDVSMIVSLGDETDEFEVIKTKSVKYKG